MRNLAAMIAAIGEVDDPVGGVVPAPVLIEATIFDAIACGMCIWASEAFACARVWWIRTLPRMARLTLAVK
jgi:hypothetical protein